MVYLASDFGWTSIASDKFMFPESATVADFVTKILAKTGQRESLFKFFLLTSSE